MNFSRRTLTGSLLFLLGMVIGYPSQGWAQLPGVLVDDSAAVRKGPWTESTSVRPFVGGYYLHDDNAAKGEKSVREINLYALDDGTCQVVLKTGNPKKQVSVAFAKTPPVTVEEIKRLIE